VIVPYVASPPATELTLQVTDVSLVLDTVAEKSLVAPACTSAEVGSTATAMLDPEPPLPGLPPPLLHAASAAERVSTTSEMCGRKTV
jgi:hypothetical protein